MAQKAVLFGDIASATKIVNTSDPKEQKALGRLVNGFNEAVWNQHKLDIMVKGLLLKFGQNESLKQQLLATGDKILVEGSPHDKIWGVGLHYSDELILSEKTWRGQNLLGKALMEVRIRLQSES